MGEDSLGAGHSAEQAARSPPTRYAEFEVCTGKVEDYVYAPQAA